MGLIRWFKRLLGLAPAEPGGGPSPPERRGPTRPSAADTLARVRALQARNAQWADVWAELNPGDDPTVRQLLLDLRNDGLQFAPEDGLRRIELACEGAAADADVAAVLYTVLGKTDVLDRFR
jgi:hypothetical protein